ncbi:hypothetical protein IID24_02565 [Patescibacteria group bacterium]|nr:hypothetical protein [Patescibacteria group bacterium]
MNKNFGVTATVPLNLRPILKGMSNLAASHSNIKHSSFCLPCLLFVTKTIPRKETAPIPYRIFAIAYTPKPPSKERIYTLIKIKNPENNKTSSLILKDV